MNMLAVIEPRRFSFTVIPAGLGGNLEAFVIALNCQLRRKYAKQCSKKDARFPPKPAGMTDYKIGILNFDRYIFSHA
jgi:hypothetical protein